MPLSIQRRHPEFQVWKDAAEFLWASYAGGREYRGEMFLDKYPREIDPVYQARMERAYYLNYVAGVIDTYISSVYRRPPVREPANDEESTDNTELSGVLAEFVKDATGTGVNLSDFMRTVATFALAAERSFVVVDMDEGVPYVHQLHPANLLDYSAPRGVFDWALTTEQFVDDSDPFSDRVEEVRYRLWTPDEWRVFDSDLRQVDSGPNRAQRVPIVYVPGINVNLPVYDIARISKRIYNLCSQLDEILINDTFPQRYMQGDGVENEQGEAIADDVAPITTGTARMLLLPPESTMAPGFLSPPDGPAKLHIEERERLIESIYSLAGLERRDPDTQTAQSGVAKAYDFRETNERMVSLAQTMEAAELEVFELLAAYGVPTEANVTYNKDFYVEDFTVQLDNYLKITPAALPAEVKRRAALEVSMSIAEEATEEERRVIRQAVEDMPDAELNPNRSRTRSIIGELSNPLTASDTSREETG